MDWPAASDRCVAQGEHGGKSKTNGRFANQQQGRPQIMVAHAYVGANEQLVRTGWVEIFRTATGELIAVPSIPAHTAPQYLHATIDGDVVVVTVKKRALNG